MQELGDLDVLSTLPKLEVLRLVNSLLTREYFSRVEFILNVWLFLSFIAVILDACFVQILHNGARGYGSNCFLDIYVMQNCYVMLSQAIACYNLEEINGYTVTMG